MGVAMTAVVVVAMTAVVVVAMTAVVGIVVIAVVVNTSTTPRRSSRHVLPCNPFSLT